MRLRRYTDKSETYYGAKKRIISNKTETRQMTQDGLTDLEELVSETEELQRKADELDIRICNLYRYDEDVLDRDVHMRLSDAGAAMTDAGQCLNDALIGLQKAYKAEKELMKLYNVLPNEQDDDEE